MEMTTLVIAFIVATQTYHLPKGLLNSLCFVESAHNIHAVHKDDGNGDSLGVCQVKLNTARMLGFTGTQKELMSAKTNIKYAAKYLSKQLDRYDGDSTKAIAAYNSGTFKRDQYD